MERFPSGQREQTVNLPADAYGGSNPPLSTIWHTEALSDSNAEATRRPLG